MFNSSKVGGTANERSHQTSTSLTTPVIEAGGILARSLLISLLSQRDELGLIATWAPRASYCTLITRLRAVLSGTF